MIHGIYLKTRPKGSWHLVTTALSPEAATYDLVETLRQAKADGNEKAEAVIQTFESVFWIPQYLTSVKETKALYN